MTRLALCIGALVAGALAASPALAQEAVLKGEGYKLSEGLVLHSSARAEGGMVSNVFFEADDEDPVASGTLRLGGDLRVASRSGERLGDGARQRLTLDAGLGLTYREFLSGNPNARAQRDLDIDAFGGIVAFPEGTLSLVAKDSLTRKSRPTNFESSSKLNRLVNQLTLGTDWRPGSGTMTFGLRYRNKLDLFERADAPYPDRMHHSGHLQASWRLLPVTRLFFDGSVGYYDTLGEPVLPKRNATNLQASLGLATAFTERTNAEAHVGYKHTNYDEGESFSGVVGGLSLSHRYSPFGKATLGYERAVRDSINANFYKDHRIHATVDQQIDQFVAGAGGEIRFRRYGGVPAVVGGDQGQRDDLILASNASLRYLLRDSISASLRYRVSRVATDFVTVDQGDDPSYVRHSIFAGFSAAF